MKNTHNVSTCAPARRELLNWIVTDQQQRRTERSAEKIKLDADADVLGIQYGRLLDFDDLSAAFKLVYNAYVRQGLIKENAAEMRILPHQLLPTTEVLGATLRGDVINTLSLVRDGELGLPLEKLYREEVALRRSDGTKVAEISSLADRRRQSRSASRSSFRVLFRVMCLAIQTGAQREVDELLIAVHPRHSRFYQRRFGFTVAGEVKNYDMVEGNPAVLLTLNLHALQTDEPEIFARIFANPLPQELVEPVPIAAEICQQFQPLATS